MQTYKTDSLQTLPVVSPLAYVVVYSFVQSVTDRDVSVIADSSCSTLMLPDLGWISVALMSISVTDPILTLFSHLQ